MDSIGYADELIQEYLLFRGCVKTFTQFSTEKHAHASNSSGNAGGSGSTSSTGSSAGSSSLSSSIYSSTGALNTPTDAGSLSDQIIAHIRALELHEFMDLWAMLKTNFFVHLEGSHTVRESSSSIASVTGGGRSNPSTVSSTSGTTHHATAISSQQSPQIAGSNAITTSSHTSTTTSSTSSKLAIPPYESLIRRMEISLKKAFLVKAHTRRRADKMRECFDRLQSEMIASAGAPSSSNIGVTPTSGADNTISISELDRASMNSAWAGWHSLPYVTDPSSHPLFAPYFQRRWFSTLAASLRNFLVTLFRLIPLPRILAFNIEREKRKKSAAEIRGLRAELERTKSELVAATTELNRFKSQGYRVFQRTGTSSVAATPQPIRHQNQLMQQPANLSSLHQLHVDNELTPPMPNLNGFLSPMASGPSTTPAVDSTPITTPSDSTLTGPSNTSALDPEDSYALASLSVLESLDDSTARLKIVSTHPLLSHAGPVLKVRFNNEGNTLVSMAMNALDDTNSHAHEERAQTKLWNVESIHSKQAHESDGGARSKTSTINATTKSARSKDLFNPSSNSSFLSVSEPHDLDDNADDDSDSASPYASISHSTPLASLTFSKSDRYLLTGSSSDGKIGVYNLSSHQSGSIATTAGTALQQPKLVTEFVSSESSGGAHAVPCPVILDLVSSPGDRFLVSAAATKMHCECGGAGASGVSSAELQGVLEAFDLSTGKRTMVFQSSAGQGPQSECSQVNSLALTHNGNLLVSASADGMLRVWDTRTSHAMLGWSAHPLSAVSCIRLCADETTVMSAGMNGEIFEWSMHRMGKCVREFHWPFHKSGGKKSTDAHRNSATQNATLHTTAYSISSADCMARPEFALDSTASFALFTEGYGWRPEQDDALAVEQPHAYIFNLAASSSSSVQSPHPLNNHSSLGPSQRLLGHAAPLLSVDWHPSHSMFVTAAMDHTARVVCLESIES